MKIHIYNTIVSGYKKGSNMKPTIRDVAKLAGVSVATVSRYLNKSPLISDSTARVVEDVIKELHYQPNMMAQGLLNGQTKTVGLAINDNDSETYGNEYFLKMQYGIEHELARKGYYLMIFHIGKGKKELSTIEVIVNEKRIDGLIILSELANSKVVNYLQLVGLPYIIAGRSNIENTSWVDVDNIKAGEYAVECLIRGKANRIGFLTNSLKKIFVKERYEGTVKCLNKHNLVLNNDDVVENMSTYADVEAYVVSNLERLCEAYVISDSIIAFYFLNVLSKYCISVPQTVQIVSFDDSIFSKVSEPEMTVVNIDVTNIGTTVAKCILGLIKDNIQQQQLLLPVNIIERRTTKKT